MGKKRQQMSPAVRYAVQKFIHENAEALADLKHAELLGQIRAAVPELNIELRASVLKDAFRNVGAAWNPPVDSDRGYPALHNRCAILECEVAALMDRVEILETALRLHLAVDHQVDGLKPYHLPEKTGEMKVVKG